MALVFILLGVNMVYIGYMNVTSEPDESARVDDGTHDLQNTEETVEDDSSKEKNSFIPTQSETPRKISSGISLKYQEEETEIPDTDKNTPENGDSADGSGDEAGEGESEDQTETSENGDTEDQSPEKETMDVVPPAGPDDTEEEPEEENDEEEETGEEASKIEYDFTCEENYYCPADRTSLACIRVGLAIDNSYAVTNIQWGLINPTEDIAPRSFTIRIPEKAMLSNLTMELNERVYYSFIIPDCDEKHNWTAPDKMAVFIKWLDHDMLQMNLRVPPLSFMKINLRYETFLTRYLGDFSYEIPLQGINSYENIGRLVTTVDLYHHNGLDELEISGPVGKTDLNITNSQAAGIVVKDNQSHIPDIKFTYSVGEPPLQGDVTVHNDGDGGYFLLRFSPSQNALQEAPVPKHIIFVIDRSGSMSGNKISQVKTAFEFVVNDLPEDDMFNVLTFSTGVEQYKSEIIAVSENNKAQAVSFISGISASGSTNFNQAALDALSLLNDDGTGSIPIVVLLTDGNPTAGVTPTNSIRNNIKDANTMRSSVFCLGFGADVDFTFLQATSMENYGQAIKISEYGDPTTQITDFYKTISTPLLQSLDFSFSPEVYDVSETDADYLFAGTDIAVTGRFTQTETIDIAIDALGKNGNRQFADTVDIGENDDNPFVARLWAYQKIESIIEEMKVFGETSDLIQQVVDLSCEYNFLTEYTCFVIEVDDLNVWNPENEEAVQEDPEPEPEEEPEEDPDDEGNASNRSRAWSPFPVEKENNDDIAHPEGTERERWTEERKTVIEKDGPDVINCVVNEKIDRRSHAVYLEMAMVLMAMGVFIKVLTRKR